MEIVQTNKVNHANNVSLRKCGRQKGHIPNQNGEYVAPIIYQLREKSEPTWSDRLEYGFSLMHAAYLDD